VTSRSAIALEAASVASAVLTMLAWFAGWPHALPAALPALATAALVAIRCWEHLRPLPRLRPETLVCLGLAVLYRLPALVYPWGFVNKDGFYGAMAALHILQGDRPAPVFSEGANYQGTLKAHLSALIAAVSGASDLSFLLSVASVLLSLGFVASTMALARRAGGRSAALVAGLYLALGPKFVTTFSLNCQGQYGEVLALGGVALAFVAGLLDEGPSGASARFGLFGVGSFLGLAFWQQPIALSFVVAAGLALALRRSVWRDVWALALPLGLLVGAFPVLVWNVANGWATSEIMGEKVGGLEAVVFGLPGHVARTIRFSFPIVSGVSPGHPWLALPGFAALAAAIPFLVLGAYLAVRGPRIVRAVRSGRPGPDIIPPLLMAVTLGLFWAVPADLIHKRPRYLLPLAGAIAVQLGVVAAWGWSRSRMATVLGVVAVLALNVSGTAPRLAASRAIAEQYAHLVRSIDEKGIRTAYSDFSLSAPLTMFTAERIVVSPRLGPTPNYEVDRHATKVAAEGPDAYILLPADDPERFAALLRGLGVRYRLSLDPVPVFDRLSRRVRIEEVQGFRGDDVPPPAFEE
jgi:hypothetical protein